MILQQSTEFANIDTPESRAFLAADGDATADLPFESTADLSPTPVHARLDAPDSASPQASGQHEVATTLTVDSDSSPVHDRGAAGTSAVHRPPLAPMPERRAVGFFAFAACALIAILFAAKQSDSSNPKTAAAMDAKPRAGDTQLVRARVAGLPAVTRKKPDTAENRAAQSIESKRGSAEANTSFGVVAFQSRSFVTSEQAIAAVFILKRTQGVRGTAQVRWSARSGSADAGVDFSDASGTARFADGQRQVAIYVPLRNDLLKEQDETFKVCLRSPRQARIGGRSCAEVTMLDDDDIGPT